MSRYTRGEAPADRSYKFDYLFGQCYSDAIVGRIQMDDVAMYSVTRSGAAAEISHMCYDLAGKTRARLLEPFACVGGNTMPFLKTFAHVMSIELDPCRFAMLQHNVHVACSPEETDKWVAECGDYRSVCEGVAPGTFDVAFLDPPWGGPGHEGPIRVHDDPVRDLVAYFLSKCRHVVIKLPCTYDVAGEFDAHGIRPEAAHYLPRYGRKKMLVLIFKSTS